VAIWLHERPARRSVAMREESTVTFGRPSRLPFARQADLDAWLEGGMKYENVAPHAQGPPNFPHTLLLGGHF